MEEPKNTLENILHGIGWDAPLPTVIYQDGEEHAEKQTEIKESFKIDDPNKADWAIRRLRESGGERDEHIERITTHRKKISDFEAKIRTKHKQESDFFIGLLRDWATDEIKKSKGKEKNVKCIEGTLAFRSAQAEMVYEIDDTIKAAKRNGFLQVIVMKETISKTELRKAMNDGADLPVKFVRKEDSFKVSFADD